MTAKSRKLMQGVLAVSLMSLVLLSVLVPLAGCTATRASQNTLTPEPEPEPEKPPVNPLTGEEVASIDLITRRPLAVKVENDPKARPQSGIIDADLVYEELVEGGITRFICIYLSKDAQAIGPTRSARPSDIDITFYLNPLLICSGGSNAVISMVQASGLMYITEDATHFWRERSRRAPHNLYTSTALLWQYLAEAADTYGDLPVSGLYFASEEEEEQEQQDDEEEIESTQAEEAAGEEGAEDTGVEESVMVTPATVINIPYKAPVCAASYQYEPVTETYLHFIQGAAHTDLTTGQQVAPRNVIVQYVVVTGSGLRDVTGSAVPLSQVLGSGNCLVFTGGNVYHGTWKKDNRSSPTRFVDENGNDIPLNPGQTWIHLVSEDIAATYQ